MTPKEFAEFRHDAVHALMGLNEKCESKFKISKYPRWDYDLDDGTLTFSEDGVARVVASIQVVGTTSEADRTWLWSWANNSLPSAVTSAMADVRSFGLAQGATELITPSAADDEYLGWGMTAVAAKILGAVGAYRCPRKNGGFLYFVYMDISFADLPSAKPGNERISCNAHGDGYATYVCEHLISNPAQKWFSDEPSQENRWPDAWCAACEAVWEQKREWGEGDTRFRVQVLCHCCYQSLRSRAVT